MKAKVMTSVILVDIGIFGKLKKDKKINMSHLVSPKKTVAIVETYNSLELNHLQRFFKYHHHLFDAIVVLDQGSTDGTVEYARKFTPFILRDANQRFEDNLFHRKDILSSIYNFGECYIFHARVDEVIVFPKDLNLVTFLDEKFTSGISSMQSHVHYLWNSLSWVMKAPPYLTRERTLIETKEALFRSSEKNLPYLEKQNPSRSELIKQDQIHIISYRFINLEQIANEIELNSSQRKNENKLQQWDGIQNIQCTHISSVLNWALPLDLVENENHPPPLSPRIIYETITKKLLNKTPHVSIVSLIYKSNEWLEFVLKQVFIFTELEKNEFFFVANDPYDPVVDYLRKNRIQHKIHNNSDAQKNEWYINNVYRAWNFAGKESKGRQILFINSDMAFTSDWLCNLLKSCEENICLTSRLVESGKLRSGIYGVEKNFGRLPSHYLQSNFISYKQSTQENKILIHGLYMPLLIKREHFLKIGMFPEGNITVGSDIWNPKIGTINTPVVPGDQVFMEKLRQKNIHHQTVFDSIVYHFQCGEMDEKKSSSKSPKHWRKVFHFKKENTEDGWTRLLQDSKYIEIISKNRIELESNFLYLKWNKIKEFHRKPFNIQVEIVLANCNDWNKLPIINNRHYFLLLNESTKIWLSKVNQSLFDRVDITLIVTQPNYIDNIVPFKMYVLDISKDEKTNEELEFLFTKTLDQLTIINLKAAYLLSLEVQKSIFIFYFNLTQEILTHLKDLIQKNLMNLLKSVKKLIPTPLKKLIKVLLKKN
jgi:hypothetical protein